MTQKEKQIISAIQKLEVPSDGWSILETYDRNGEEITSIAVHVEWAKRVMISTKIAPTETGEKIWYWDSNDMEAQQ